MRPFYRRSAVVFTAVVLLSLSCVAQTIEKGAISGTVTDPSGAVVPNATVKITHVATGDTRTVTTDAGGNYSAPTLPVGEYSIEVTASNFGTTRVKNVQLAVGQRRIQDVTLKVVGVGETVEVISEGGLDKSDALANNVLNRRYVEDLPISGRDFRDFTRLVASAQDNPGLRSGVRLGGQFSEFTSLVIDGVDNRNSFFGEWFGSLETKNFTYPQDAVQEFQVRTNGFSAEFGHSTGGLINVVTKQGTNEWHGSAHYFWQSDGLYAETQVPGDPSITTDDITVLPPFENRHQFGGTFGGPIAKDRAFVFLAMDVQRQSGPLTVDFGGNTGGANPATVLVPAIYGLPAGTTIADLEGTVPQSQNLFTPLGRLDVKVTPNNTLTTRFNYTRNSTANFAGGRGQTLTSGAESNLEDFLNDGYTIAPTWTTVINPTTVNEVRFAYSTEKRPREAKGPNPEAIIFGFGNIGQRFFLPITSDHKRYQVMDNFSKTFGKHDIRLGVDYNANSNSQVFIGFAGGAYFFGSLADFAAPAPLFMIQLVGINGFDAVESGTVPNFYQHEVGIYLQDNWKVTPRLTLNLGVRWDGVKNPQPQFTPIPGNEVPYGPPRRVGDAIEFETGPVPQSIPSDYDNFSPRVGVSYDLTGNGKTILRGGAGLYFTALPSIFMAEILSGTGLRGGQPFLAEFAGTVDFDCTQPSDTTLTPPRLCYPDILPSMASMALQTSLGPPLIRYADPGLEVPRTLNVQLGIEHEIAKNFSLAGTYTYARSDNLRIGGFWNSRYDRNFRPPGHPLDMIATDFDSFGRVINVAARGRLDPTISTADALTSFGRARYHSLKIEAKKSFSNRYQFGINYLWSKNDDNVSNDRDTDSYFSPSDPFNLDADYGRGQLDIAHQFTSYAVFQLPRGFQFSTSIRARSGTAFPVFSGFCGGPTDFNGDGACSGVGAYNPDRPTVGGVLLGRYPERQPSFFNWDVRVGKEFGLTERHRLRATFEVFNLTNRDNLFSEPISGGTSSNAILGSGTFKFLDRTDSPINAQIGVKYTF